MKINKYIIVLVTLVTLYACGDDDFSRQYVDTENKTALVGQLQLLQQFGVPGGDVPFSVTIPQTFSVESVVEVTATFLIPNADLEVIKGYVTIAAGSSTGEGSITVPDIAGPGEFNGVADFISVVISGIALTQPEEGSVDDPFIMTSESVSFDLYDQNGNYNAPYPVDFCNTETLPGECDGVLEPWLVISLDWEGPYGSGENDIDLYVRDEAQTANYESSASGSRFEGDFFNGNWFPDGVYVIYVDIYTLAPGVESLPIRFFATDQNNNVTVIETSISESGIIGTITKSGGETNDITYVVEPIL